MSWQDARLAALRRAAGMGVQPEIPENPPVGFDWPTYPRPPELVPYKRPDGHVAPCYWSPHALAYREAVIAHVTSGHALRQVDQLAFARVIKAADEGYKATKAQLDQYKLAREYGDFLTEQWDAYGRAIRPFAWQINRKWKAWNEGGCEGPEPPAWNYYVPGDEVPDVPGAPSPVLAYKKETARMAGVTEDAIDKRIDARKKAHAAVFGDG